MESMGARLNGGLLTSRRTVTCSFSEYKIYPGHGGMFIRKDGQVKEVVNHSFLASAFPQQQGLLPERAEEEARPYQMDCLLETQQQEGRGIFPSTSNLILQTAEKSKRRSKKSFKVQRAVVGMSIADIQKKRDQREEITKKSKEAALA